jgi:mRNA-degrading endonuclease YafQ of YafQ-DinJ toxin-antitoxin module
MWTLYEKKSAVKALGTAPDEVLVRYEAWKRIVEATGPHGLRHVKGFHDEALKGPWLGYRSSRLGIKWRVIYMIVKDALEVYVIEITPHDYRRKR